MIAGFFGEDTVAVLLILSQPLVTRQMQPTWDCTGVAASSVGWVPLDAGATLG